MRYLNHKNSHHRISEDNSFELNRRSYVWMSVITLNYLAEYQYVKEHDFWVFFFFLSYFGSNLKCLEFAYYLPPRYCQITSNFVIEILLIS